MLGPLIFQLLATLSEARCFIMIQILVLGGLGNGHARIVVENVTVHECLLHRWHRASAKILADFQIDFKDSSEDSFLSIGDRTSNFRPFVSQL